MFLPSPRYLWWFGSYKKSIKMVDYQMNLEDWLQDASLFLNKPVDYHINFDDLLNNEKANSEGSPAILGLSDLGWLDAKVDLSVFDNPNGLLDHPNETEELMNDDEAILLGFLNDGFNPSYLTSDAMKNVGIDLSDCLNTENYTGTTSSEIFDTHLASPGCTMLHVNSPVPVQSPANPYSDISDAPEETSSSLLQSVETSDLASDGISSSEVFVVVSENDASPSSSSEEILSIEEISSSMRKRKFVSNGEDVHKVKVILKDLPYSVGKCSKPKDRRERKKVQNKEAAARYRIKKRVEEREISDEIAGLESTQKKLNVKHDELQSEIKYLKSLMCEILQKRGLME